MRPGLLGTLLLLVLAVVSACDRARDALPWADGADAPPLTFQRQTRTLLFLADSADEPVASAIHFVVEPAGERVGRTVALWIGGPGGWERLMNERWREAAIREPARLMPREDLRLILDTAGEVAAISYRGTAPGLRLVPGATLAEATHAGATLRLRSGTLSVGDIVHGGVLLDATTGTGAPAGETAGAPVRAVLHAAGDVTLGLVADTGGTLRPRLSAGSDPPALVLRPGEGGWEAVDTAGALLGALRPAYPVWPADSAGAPVLATLIGTLDLPGGPRRVVLVLDRQPD